MPAALNLFLGFFAGAMEGLGRCTLLAFDAARWTFTPPLRLRYIFQQFEFVGLRSVGIVVLTGTFSGAVLALNAGYAFRLFGAEGLVGMTSVLALTRELGPVLCCLMITARAGSAMAAEIGSMRVTEQIDALYSMAVNPVKFLVTPRILAGLIMAPALTLLFDFVGTVGSYVVSVYIMDISSGIWLVNVQDYVEWWDINQGLVKAAVFGLILTVVGCYKGFFTTEGARGVGRATTESVVYSSVLILVTDYFLSNILLQID